MRKIIFIATVFFFGGIAGCNSSETDETMSDEPIVKDSMGVTMPPVTDRIDSAALDTLGTMQPESPVSSPQPGTSASGVQSTSENFVSNDGQMVNAVYNNNGQMSVATLTIKGEEIKLMQTEAWAKGAEYSNGKIKWRAEGDNATLTRDGKETKFSLKK